MKSARIFLAGMYFHLILSVIVPIGVLWMTGKGSGVGAIGLFLLYLLMVAAVHVAGWICAGMAIAAYKKGEPDKLKKAARLLKLGSIPFYILNFIYCFMVYGVLLGASRGMLFFIVPIPIFFTCMLIVESGVVGICYVMWLRKYPQNGKRPWAVHYFLQLISVLDMISTIVLLIKYRKKADNGNTI